MSKFFVRMKSESLLLDYAEIFDWLFDEKKMTSDAGWSSSYKAEFTKQIKTLPNLGKAAFHYNDGTPFPNPQKAGGRPRKPIVVMKSSNGEGHDFIVHLRNSIAHGNAVIYRVPKQDLYIEAKDFRDNSKQLQTAYIAIPLSTLPALMDLYMRQERKINRVKL